MTAPRRGDGESPPIVVAKRLRSPHPLVAWTYDCLKSSEFSRWGKVCGYPDCLDVAVTSGSVDRAMRIMDALIKALERRSFLIRIDADPPRKTYAEIDGESVAFRIMERTTTRRRARRLVKGPDGQLREDLLGLEVEYLPTGDLRLFLDDDTQKAWQDSEDHRIEEALTSFVDGIICKVAELRERRVRWAREAEIRAERQRQAEKVERLKRQEEERVRKLTDMQVAWTQAQQLRAFIVAVRERAEQIGKDVSPESGLGRWQAWAEECAERLDPVDRLLANIDISDATS
ncbi:hypothetical protein ACYOEI_14000 [Singulisphaera rosea]